jgi:V8-like Glu-specific endopeptidase
MVESHHDSNQPGSNNGNEPSNLAAIYRHKFRKPTGPQPESFNESASPGSGDTNISKEDIDDKAEASRSELYRIIAEHLDNDSALYSIADKLADKIATDGKDALKAVAEGNDNYLLNNPDKTSLLEVIVKVDGSRPSFMVRNGIADQSTSPVGTWAGYLAVNGDILNDAIAAVGRIDQNNMHVGTGFLIAQNLIVTNRHVLQAISYKENDRLHLMPNLTIDFGCEFRAIKTLNRRTFKKIVYCGPRDVNPYKIDHSILDMVLIELQPANEEVQAPLSLNIAPEWATAGTIVYTIGYPANPGDAGLRTYTTLLETLFKSTYSCKRLAPGEVINSASVTQPWTAAHDATTLGGNSGSVIVVSGREYAAAGLHYGGKLKDPRENWGHILANALDAPDGGGKPLRAYLEEYGVRLVDILNG